MRKTGKFVALAVSAALMATSVAAFAACGAKTEQAVAARICYDNLPDDGYTIPAEDTSITLKGYDTVKEVNAAGEEVAAGTVATYENGVLTARSAGTVTLSKGEESFRVEVVPAYATNPNNQYDTSTSTDYSESASKYLGWTHDPSLIETVENGKPAYYVFSTGWGFGNAIHRSEDLIHWSFVGRATSTSTQMQAIETWLQSKNDGVHISWWAPDIVKAPDGGYWLYTCPISAGPSDPEGWREFEGTSYAMACIVLFHSMSLQPDSFRYVGVLMQSAIPQNTGESSMDVNSIDPQIIYSPDGKMYMAYGSFGTGNWMLELDPETGLRKDGKYSNGAFLDIPTVREYRDEAVAMHSDFLREEKVESEYYGRMISYESMEGPVIARHDNVTMTDENGKTVGKAKTYYYSMHSYNPLDSGYQIWGGRSESVWGIYRSTGGGIVRNTSVGSKENGGNKYAGSFKWKDANLDTSIDLILPGHNDLFTTSDGVNVAAYIARTNTYNEAFNELHKNETPAPKGPGTVFLTQIHQYYLNSMGDIVINPNRYGGESSRPVSEEELFKYTQDRKFKLAILDNDNNHNKVTVDVVLAEDGSIKNEAGTAIGTWKMYGAGYIYFVFDQLVPTTQTCYYGVVRTAWLDDQNKSGFTITCMGHPDDSTQSYGLFLNNYSTLEGETLVG